MINKLKHLIGLDIKEEEYAYGRDPEHGYLAASKIPERWIKSTCGYCSVGCGMLLGVKDDKIVSVRGDKDHPVNEGDLCPKGLSEHYPLTSPDRAVSPLLKQSDGSFKEVEIGRAHV